MKYLIASDIHGSAYWTERLVTAIDSEQPDRIVLLGDLLYHGPRNDLPRDYAPKRVIPLLNALADRIIAVRGNCDAEVDQMVLDFPVMADYATLFDETGRELFLTHGHVFGAGMHNSVDHAPALPEGSALVYGHTHIKVNEASEEHPGLWLFNPGSVSIPNIGFGVDLSIGRGDAAGHGTDAVVAIDFAPHMHLQCLAYIKPGRMAGVLACSHQKTDANRQHLLACSPARQRGDGLRHRKSCRPELVVARGQTAVSFADGGCG